MERSYSGGLYGPIFPQKEILAKQKVLVGLMSDSGPKSCRREFNYKQVVSHKLLAYPSLFTRKI